MTIKEEIEKRIATCEIREQKLWEILQRIIEDTTNHLKLITAQMRYYDIHDQMHSEKVLDNIGKLLGNCGIEHVSLYELFLIYCCSFIHDAAMAVPVWEYNLLKSVEGTVQCHDNSLRVSIRNDTKPPQSLRSLKDFITANKKDVYGEFSMVSKFVFAVQDEDNFCIDLAQRMQDYEKFRNRFTDELRDVKSDVTAYLELSEKIRCDYIRSTHHIRVEAYVINLRNQFVSILGPGLSDKFVKYLASICRAHGDTMSLIAKLGYDEDGFCKGERISIRFIAILLCLGDIIHFSADRAPISLYSEKQIRSAESIRHWVAKFQDLKYNIREVNGKTTIFFSAYCESPETYYFLQDYMDGIDQELASYYSFIHDMEFIKFPRVDDYRIQIAQCVNRDDILPDTKVFIPERNLKFTLEQSKILSLLMGVQLYKDKYLCLRELYQNSMDACKCMFAQDQTYGINEKFFVEFGIKEITVSGETQKYLYCFDNGTGMTKEIVKNYLLRIGNSYYRSREFSEQNTYWNSSVHPISQFGIGILSCYMIADKLEITTKHYESGANIISFALNGPNEQFYYINTDKLDAELIGKHGTIVKIFLHNKIAEDIVNVLPEKLNFYIHVYNNDFYLDEGQKEQLKTFHKSLFYLINRQVGISKPEIPVIIRLADNTTKPIISWDTVFDFKKYPNLTDEDLEVLWKCCYHLKSDENPYKAAIKYGDKVKDYNIHVESENIDLYTNVSLPLKDMPCNDIRIFEISRNIWNSNNAVLVDGVVVSDRSNSQLESAIGYSLKYRCLINFAGNKRPILSIDRNSIISFSDDLVQECSDLVPKLADELVKCMNTHVKDNAFAVNSQEAITTLEIVIRQFPSIAEQIVIRLIKTPIGEMPIEELKCISGISSIKEFFKCEKIKLTNLNMKNLHEISREIILGKLLEASNVIINNTNVFIESYKYLSIITQKQYHNIDDPLSLSVATVRADKWEGIYAEYDLVSQLWPIIPARLFDNICSKHDTTIIVENRSRETPHYGNSLSGIAQLDPALINPKFGISSKESDPDDRKQACYVGACERVQNMFWLPELYNFSDLQAENKDYVLFVYIAPRELNDIERIKLHDCEVSDPVYVRGLFEGWSILFVGHAKQYKIMPGITSRAKIIELLPRSLLNHEIEDRTYYNLDGTIAF